MRSTSACTPVDQPEDGASGEGGQDQSRIQRPDLITPRRAVAAAREGSHFSSLSSGYKRAPGVG